MRTLQLFIFISIALLLLTVSFANIPSLRTTIPGRVVRFCLGEPGATQWVNDTADGLISSNSSAELQNFSESLISKFGKRQSDLKSAEFSKGRVIPLDQLPARYRRFDGIFGAPELLLCPQEDQGPLSIAFSWGHMRQAIVVFSTVPPIAPTGFYVRKVSDKIFVIADES